MSLPLGKKSSAIAVGKLVDHGEDHVPKRWLRENFFAPGVDDLALLVHHVVVLEQVLTNVVVVAFDFFLRVLDRLGDPAVLDRQVFFHEAADVDAPEDAHQIVVEREIEAAFARVALAAGATAQLVIDTARFVAFGAQNEQTARGENFFASRRRIWPAIF